MFSGIEAFNSGFLADVNQIETRISRDNQQLSSGIRVSQASDDPSAVSSIIGYQAEIDRVTQIQNNLDSAKTVSSAADSALQSASALLDQLVSIGAQGANGSATPATQANLASQVQQIGQQLVSLANTSVQGRYIFGGDAPTTQPYTFNWAVPKGVVQNSNAGSTGVLRDASGDEIVPGMTAQQIFDVQNPPGTSTTGNVFQAVYDLGTALQANNQANISTATAEVKAAVTQLGQATTTYGNTENWIQNASSDASQRLVSLQQSLSSVRDADIASVATQLTTDQTALQAALQAHASNPNKSLFSYLA